MKRLHHGGSAPLLAICAARQALRISETACRMAGNSRSGRHPLQLAIVDGPGAVAIEPVPIGLFVHRAAVDGQRP